MCLFARGELKISLFLRCAARKMIKITAENREMSKAGPARLSLPESRCRATRSQLRGSRAKWGRGYYGSVRARPPTVVLEVLAFSTVTSVPRKTEGLD